MAGNEEHTKQVVLGTTEPPKIDTNDTRVSIFNSGFCDFIKKPEILRAIDDCGFEYPFKVQYKFMPEAVLGKDIVCQAQSGMGKTTGVVLASLQQVEPTEDHVYALVICNTRVRAFHISKEYKRFAPGRILAHIRSKKLNLKQLKHFIVDDCQASLEQLDMRRNIQEIFLITPSQKQVIMFSTSLSKEIRALCKKFMQFDAIEII